MEPPLVVTHDSHLISLSVPVLQHSLSQPIQKLIDNIDSTNQTVPTSKPLPSLSLGVAVNSALHTIKLARSLIAAASESATTSIVVAVPMPVPLSQPVSFPPPPPTNSWLQDCADRAKTMTMRPTTAATIATTAQNQYHHYEQILRRTAPHLTAPPRRIAMEPQYPGKNDICGINRTIVFNEISSARVGLRNKHAAPQMTSVNTSVLMANQPIFSLPTTFFDLSVDILLLILSQLTVQDLCHFAQVSRMATRIAFDTTLWRHMHINGSALCPQSLAAVGLRQPQTLLLHRCRSITATGIRALLSPPAPWLQVLSLRGCSTISDRSIEHITITCTHLQELDLGWCGISDTSGLMVARMSALTQLSLKGCHQLTDNCMIPIIERHGPTLKGLDIFGCHQITHRTIISVSQHCSVLQKLCVAHCANVSDIAITRLAPCVPGLQDLDLGGCKQIRDSCLFAIATNCPNLTLLHLAFCLLITDNGISAIADSCPRLRSLDVNGCFNVGDQTVARLISRCNFLVNLSFCVIIFL